MSPALEGNTGTRPATFVVTRSGDTTSTVSVTVSIANGTATAGSDFTTLPATIVTFAPGQTAKTVVVNVIGESIVEADESFLLNVTAPAGAVISDGAGVATVANDDP